MLLKHKVNVPCVVTEGLYPGGRSGGKNLWVNQGWLAEETTAKSAIEAGKADETHIRQNTAPGNSSPRLPPSYELSREEALLRLPPLVQPHGSQPLSCLPATVALLPLESLLRTQASSTSPAMVPSACSNLSFPAHQCEIIPASDIPAASSIALDAYAEYSRQASPLPGPCCPSPLLSSTIDYPASPTIEAEPRNQSDYTLGPELGSSF